MRMMFRGLLPVRVFFTASGSSSVEDEECGDKSGYHCGRGAGHDGCRVVVGSRILDDVGWRHVFVFIIPVGWRVRDELLFECSI